MLSGYKTYIVGTRAALGAVASFLMGEVGFADAAQLILTSLLGMTIRSGINTVKI